MTQVTGGPVPLEVLDAGDPGDPAVVLVSGFSRQLIDWDDVLVEAIVGEGFRVVRFDNRDVGRSGRAAQDYALADLAGDVFQVLDALAIGAAHLVGASMGGMIVQEAAVTRPDRVRSLTSIMSTTGARRDTVTTAEATRALTAPPATGEEELVRAWLAFWQVCGSPGYPADTGRLEAKARAHWRRGYDGAGIGRQFRAIMAPGQDRTERLRGLQRPTLVIHGVDDPLVGVEGGRAVAAAVPGAQLWEVPGMGHELPVALWPELVTRLAGFWRSAG